MRGRGYVNHINIGIIDKVTVEVIGLRGLAQLRLGLLESLLQVYAVHVAQRHKTTLLVRGEVVAAAAYAARSDDTLGQLVVGGDVTRASEYAARDDRKQRHASQSL